ncbi:MAG: ABC transporter permease subunit [Deltaproteobacteria bacterium]|nr:ABC transporter permease subunit [Deltaproteobacteria bacterium]
MRPPHSTRARPAPRGGGFAGEPNPLLVRELRQALRLPRLPWQISAVVALIGLGMLSIGSLEGKQGRPAQLGVGLFQGFISILLAYVSLMGPATAAGAIATEREGKTLEPLLLTGLTPTDIARGKFLAAFGTIALQVLALFPLAAIPFLFGGVTAAELIVAVAYVMIVAAVSVAFGLAVASRTQTLRAALAISVVLPAAALPVVFGMMLGFGEAVSRKKWPFLQAGGPIWWASAYTSVPFGLDYLLWLILWPLVVIGLPFWLFSAMTASNLAGANDDRSTAIKRWFVGSTLAVSVVGFLTCFRVDANSAVGAAILMQGLIAVLMLLGVTLIVGDPLSPSRLVRARWERLGAGPLRRFLGPGLLRGGALVIGCAMISLGVCFAGGVLGSSTGGLRAIVGTPSSTPGASSVASALAIVVLYTLLFTTFLVGFASFLRTRKASSAVPVARAWTIAFTVIALVVPWILYTILGSFDRASRENAVFAAPSPAYAYFAFERELKRYGDGSDHTIAALGASLAWGAIGLVLLGVAWERARRAVSVQDRIIQTTQRRLDEEAEEDEDDEAEEPKADAPPPMPGDPGDVA